MKKILLTGSGGFIGKNILESYLSKQYTICAPRSKELDLLDTEAVDSFFRRNNFDAVIHGAIKPGHRNAKDLNGLFYSNTRMFFNLAKNKNHFGKFINLGSGAVYDCEHYMPKMKEEYFGKYIPKDEHGFSKYVINKYMENEKDYIDLRIFGIYGKYEDYEIRFISNAICKTLFDLPITIKQNRLFDYIYIDDLYPVLEFFIENDSAFEAYNITPDRSATLFEIAKTVKKIAGKNNEIIIAKDNSGTQYSGDNSRLKTSYSGVKFTDIRKGIENLYNYYKSNLTLIDRDKLLFDK